MLTKSKILAELQQMQIGLADSERRDIYNFLFRFLDGWDDGSVKILLNSYKRRR